ncbi:MAG TPA: polyamine ABC transporter substrate-binding protein [Steroidobacteraceae bacterium]|nr:polyamine ABC transporter substrate-binding protein [Steroidobacteraceae bacterium]
MIPSRRRLVLAAGAAAFALAACGPKPPVAAASHPVAEDKIVNVLNWSDYIAPDTIEKFEKETGIKVNYDVFDSNEVLETKLLTGRTGYDVVVPTDYFLERQAKQGILLPLDKSKLPNLKNIDPEVLKHLQGADPGNRYGVPYAGVVTGIGYNVAKIKKVLGNQPVDSWAIVFDPKFAAKLKDCGYTMLDQEGEIIFSAKIWLGIDTASERLEDLAAAEAMLLKVRPFVRYFNSSQYINDLANGETCIAISWSGDVLQARDRAAEAGKGIELAFAVPKEGALQSFDMLAIPADAPHPDNAHKFIDFLMRADIAADFTKFRKFPSGNLAAEKLVDAELRADPMVFPPADVIARLKPHRAESLSYTRYANRAWTRIRTGR